MSYAKMNTKEKGQRNTDNFAEERQMHHHLETRDLRVTGNGSALYEQMMRAVRKSADEAHLRHETLEDLEEKVKALGKALQAEPKNTSKIKQMLDLIKEHHEWAFPAIAAVVAKVGPMVAALL